MIKIYPKMWYIINDGREENLAYMCPYETNPKDSTQVLDNVAKMQETGRSWACYYSHEQGKRLKSTREAIFDNLPTEGFYIGSSVSRWSTSNKLFRVKDPRGFTVEVPTGNISTLLHNTTVDKGVIKEACVWGRENNNLILLPVNSDIYLETLEKNKILNNNDFIKFKDLKPGDIVSKFDEDSEEYQFIGNAKITWGIRFYTYGWHGYVSVNYPKTYLSQTFLIKETKWKPYFVCRFSNANKKHCYYIKSISNMKIEKIIQSQAPYWQEDSRSSEYFKNKSSYWHCPLGLYKNLYQKDWEQRYGTHNVRVEETIVDVEFQK